MEIEKKPLKAKNLKVIDHLGTLYATFDGSAIWKLDKVVFGIWKICDGKKTVDEIVKEVAKKAIVEEKDLRPVLEDILDELTRMKFIEWI